MRDRTTEARQLIGCGYLPPPAEKLLPYVERGAWDHAGRTRSAGEPSVCAGYVCSLPEVIEATHAASWKRDGELTQWCEGQIATPALREAIGVLEIEYGRVEAWALDNPVKKDG